MLLILKKKKGVERLLQFLLSPQQLLCPWWQPDQQGNHEIKCLSFCGFSIFKMAHISWPWLKINYDFTHLPRTSPCLWSPMPTFVNWSFAWGNVLDHETASPHHFKRETVSNHVKEDSWKAKIVSCLPHFRVISSRHLKFSVEIE